MVFSRYGSLFNVLMFTLALILIVNSAQANGYEVYPQRNRYAPQYPTRYAQSSSRGYNEPAFSIRDNLRSFEKNTESTQEVDIQEKLDNSDLAADLDESAVSKIGSGPTHHVGPAHVSTAHVGPAHVAPAHVAPTHRVAPVHVAPRPHHVKVIEPVAAPVVVETKASAEKPIIDPFKDEEAEVIASEEFAFETEIERENGVGSSRTANVDATGFHSVNLNLCPCQDDVMIAAPVQFFEHGDETKERPGIWMWLMLALFLIGLILIAILLALFYQRKPVIPTKKFVIERKNDAEDDDEIEREIQRQLEAKINAQREPVQQQHQEVEQKLAHEILPAQASPDGSSSKKIVKKRIVKMMKDGKLVAEKEEILDEEGNVLKTQIRKQED